MNRYELLTIFSATLTDEEKDAVVKKYTDLIETNKGKLVGINKWGVKKLAYPKKKTKDGYYVLFEFDAEPTLPQKISELMNIDEAVMRSLCLKKEA